MRMSWLVLLVCLTFALLSDKAKAQQEVLDSLIDLALKNNPELSTATHVRKSTVYSAHAAAALPDPSLSIGVLNLPTNSFALDETPMSGVSVGLTQMIPWPGKLGARSDLANTRQAESEANEQTIRNRVVREVTDAYLDYAYWSKSLTIIEAYIELLKGTEAIAEVRYANGDASAQDFLRASSMLSRTEIRLLQTEQNRYSSLLRLRQSVGDTADSTELPAILAEPETYLMGRTSIDKNPMLAGAASTVERAEAGYRLARTEYWPDFSLGVDYRFRQNVAGDPIHGTDFITFKVGVSLPLWFFAKQKHNVRAAKQMILSSKSRERSVHDFLTTKYDDAVSKLSVTSASLGKYDSSLVPEATAAVEAAEVAYEVGKVDFNALLAAQSDAFEIRLERLDLLRQYHKTKAALAELAGTIYER